MIKTPEDAELYEKQRFWPFDKHKVAKIALGIIFAEYVYIANNAPPVIQEIIQRIADFRIQ